jgi:hypothetical protein
MAKIAKMQYSCKYKKRKQELLKLDEVLQAVKEAKIRYLEEQTIHVDGMESMVIRLDFKSPKDLK